MAYNQNARYQALPRTYYNDGAPQGARGPQQGYDQQYEPYGHDTNGYDYNGYDGYGDNVYNDIYGGAGYGRTDWQYQDDQYQRGYQNGYIGSYGQGGQAPTQRQRYDDMSRGGPTDQDGRYHPQNQERRAPNPPHNQPSRPAEPPDHYRRAEFQRYPRHAPGERRQDSPHRSNGDTRQQGGRQQPPDSNAGAHASVKQVRKPLIEPDSPVTLSFDNPFPVFPSKKNKQPLRNPALEGAMNEMSLQSGRTSEEQSRPTIGSSKRSKENQHPHLRHPQADQTEPVPYSNHSQGRPVNGVNGYGDGAHRAHPVPPRPQGPPQRQPYSPQQHLGPQDPWVSSSDELRARNPYDSFQQQQHPMQQQPQPQVRRSSASDISRAPNPQARQILRPQHPSALLQDPPYNRNPPQRTEAPQNPVSVVGNRGHERQRQQWQDPGPSDGYYGPVSPTYIPPRPSTAESNPRANTFPRPTRQQPQGPVHGYAAPQMPAAQVRNESLGDLYDDYYNAPEQANNVSRPTNGRNMASEEEMPRFDFQDQESVGRWQANRIDQDLHLPPATSPPEVPAVPALVNHSRNGSLQQNVENANHYHRSRSQPDLHRQQSNADNGDAVFEMPGDVPEILPMPQMPYNSQQGHRSQSNERHSPQQQGYPPPTMPPRQFHRPGAPPIQRNTTVQSQWSDPGPGAGAMNPSAMQPRPNVRPNGTSPPQAVQPFQRPHMSAPRHSEPDPHHPPPIRPGLVTEGSPSPQPAKPPPVRQYNNEALQGQTNAVMPPSIASKPSSEKQISATVTHEELQRLRGVVKANPNDNKTQLHLAQKLVEAATVLPDDNGRADPKTRAKNRERYTLEAYKLVKKLATSANYPDAQFYLADCYGQGLLGLEVDPKEAFSLYQSAAKAGHAPAAYRTAVCCELGADDGGGTRRDPLKAVQWYRRAAALGDPPAMYKMGVILLKGLLGQQRNAGEALTWLQRAADRADEANPHALHELGLLYEAGSSAGNGSGSGSARIIRDEPYALQLFTQAARLGYKFAQFRLGEAFEYGQLGCAIDARQSIAWYSKAAAQAEHQAELALSGWYLTGSQGILEQSDTEAYLWARKAAGAEPPLPKAMFAMGYFTEVGIGCPRSLEEAKRWYGRAAAYKFPKALERLEELKRGGSKVQKSRERLSRSNQKQQEADCVLM